MEEFTEEHSKLLLRKEWLVKVDSSKGVPYLFASPPTSSTFIQSIKFTTPLQKTYFSPPDLSCFVVVTDTKSVWAEVLTSKLLARRWRACNQASPEPFAKTGDEDGWREGILDLLTKTHTIGGLADSSFDVVDSNYADLAFELECEPFKWRWETCFLGHQRSSEIISKHLLFPLISLSHLSFTSAEALNELSDGDMEKTVDKLARTARRTVDNHVKNALSKPRLATSISRMTAMFNFVPELPSIQSISEKPILEVPQIVGEHGAGPSKSDGVFGQHRYSSRTRELVPERTTQRLESREKNRPIEPDSATESDEDEKGDAAQASRATSPGPSGTLSKASAGKISPMPQAKAQASDSESSPQRPAKKAKPAASSTDDDSERDHVKSRSTSTVPASGVKRTMRQPMKRGGKRF